MDDDPRDLCAKCGKAASDTSNINSRDRRFLTSKLPKCLHCICQECFDKNYKTRTIFECPFVVDVKMGTLCKEKLSKDVLDSKRARDEIEMDIDRDNRKRLRTIFNKTEEDFDGQAMNMRKDLDSLLSARCSESDIAVNLELLEFDRVDSRHNEFFKSFLDCINGCLVKHFNEKPYPPISLRAVSSFLKSSKGLNRRTALLDTIAREFRLRLFSDYSEFVERIIAQLNSGETTFEDNKKIKEYNEKNRNLIAKNEERRIQKIEDEVEEIKKSEKIISLTKDIHKFEDDFNKEDKRLKASGNSYTSELHNRFHHILEKKRAELRVLRNVVADVSVFSMFDLEKDFLQKHNRSTATFHIDERSAPSTKQQQQLQQQPAEKWLSVCNAGGFDRSAESRRNWAAINSDIDSLAHLQSMMTL